MITPSLSNWVIVLDLDDTLYNEADYVLSGIRAVTEQINTLYGGSLDSELLRAHATGTKDIWGLACALLGLPIEAKESLLWMYRLHSPAISLEPTVASWLDGLREREAALAVLTDGRSVTQRLKLRALGLADVVAYISEEYGSEKPMPDRFKKIMERWPGKYYAYIGDNTRKDFIAPNRLGWLTIGLMDSGRNVHPQDWQCCDERAPRHWVKSVEEVDRYLS